MNTRRHLRPLLLVAIATGCNLTAPAEPAFRPVSTPPPAAPTPAPAPAAAER
ncbi:MAG: hypothetical protein JWM10_3909, partial [Myxococcaceae bacterium]|nr:hypothetical protein [Myxococcaceae bacterium]